MMIDLGYALAAGASMTACTVVGLVVRQAIGRLDRRRDQRRKAR